jgi:phospholipid N-methyltransferase
MEPKHTEKNYQGTELELFSDAINWKTYWSKSLRQYAAGTVIEVGAGIGSSTKYICAHSDVDRCICLEPDPNFAVHLSSLVSTGFLPNYCEIRCSVLSDLPKDVQADAIFYIDVLEHIENDVEEVAIAATHLMPGGRLVVLSPAFSWLYTPFDKAIGHYRRYSRKDVKRLTAPGLEVEHVFFLDSLGMLLSMANPFILRSETPSAGQIKFWDRNIVPISIYVDRVFGIIGGRSIVIIWKKN